MWSLRNLMRLAHAEQCRELSDRARSQAGTYADASARGGELVSEAEQLVREAEEVLVLAVATERTGGTSWEQIGERLGEGVSRQAATKRFAQRVDELELDTLLPARQPDHPGALGWSAGPDGVQEPDRTVRRLDEWAARHREPTDPGRQHSDELVSRGLREGHRPAVDFIGAVTRLASLLGEAGSSFSDVELPPGVSERYARRRLLEFKVAAYDAMLDSDYATNRHETSQELSRAHDELVEICTAETREALSFTWSGDVDARVTLHDRPVAGLQRTIDTRDPEATGWWLWGLDADAEPDERGGAWPQLIAVSLGAEREHVEHAAAQQIATHVGADRAKGVGPFDLHGIAGETQPRD